MKHMVKLFLSSLFFMPFFFSPIVIAEDYSQLKKKEGCYVKLYRDGDFQDVNPSKFYGQKLLTRTHKKNKKYSVFKQNEKTYVTKTSCLVLEDEDSDDELRNLEENNDLESLNRKTHSKKIDRIFEHTEKNFFIHLAGGKPFVLDKKRIFEWDQFDGTICDEDYPGQTCQVDDPPPSEYATGAVFSFKFGWAASDGDFWLISFKTFKGKKQETPTFNIGNVDTYKSSFTYDDRLSSLLFGRKFIFNQDSAFRPTITISLGANAIDSTVKSSWLDEDVKFRAAGLTASVEAGLELMLNDHFGITLGGGYQYLGTQTFRLVDKKDETLEKGFRTKQDYSFFFLEGGLISYF